MRFIRRLTWLVVTGLGNTALLGACSDRAWVSEAPNESGSLGLALELDPSIALGTVHYELSGPNGSALFGDIDVSGKSRIVHVFERLPAGSYSIDLSAAGAHGAAACFGSADFVVRAHETTSVTVKLNCRVESRTGSVVINGVLNVCPTIESLAAVPRTLIPGESANFHVIAKDIDNLPQALGYRWRATSGTLSDDTTRNPTFTASEPGTVTVELVVSDGDCSDTWSVDVLVLADASSSDAPSTSEPTATSEPAPETSTPPLDSSTAPPDSASTSLDSGNDTTADSPVFNAPELVATAVGARAAASTTTTVSLPDSVRTGDFAVAFLLATGTSHAIAKAPTGFVSRDLAAINHRLSYGTVSEDAPLGWELSASATTSATVYFFRGEGLAVHVAATGSTTSANFDVTASTNAPSSTGSQSGFALLSIQLPINNPPTISAGPNGNWLTPPVSDGVQLFTWHQPYAWARDAGDAFALPGASGSVLSASTTKRTAQVVVYAPAL